MKDQQPLQINYVHSWRKAEAVKRIIREPNPSRNQRLWMCNFLMHCGYLERELLDLLKVHVKWQDFDYFKTKDEIGKIYNYGKSQNAPLQVKILSPPSLPPFNAPIEGEKKSSLFVPPQINDTSIFGFFNNAFFQGCQEFAYEYAPGQFNRHEVVVEPMHNAIYRSIEGVNHILWVIDVDTQSEFSLDLALATTRQIAHLEDFDIIKFSGKKGFHLIARLPKDFTYKSMYNRTLDIYNKLDLDFVSFTDKPKNKKQVNLDPKMYSRRRLIRGFCIHMQSKLYSVPILSTDTINIVLKKAQLKDKSFFNANSGKLSTETENTPSIKGGLIRNGRI